MIAYFIKLILCSGLLLAIYFLLLEKEKMYQFNRFYLLFSIIFSFVVPLVSIKTNIAPILVLDNPIEQVFYDSPADTSPGTVSPGANIQAQEKVQLLPIILLILYCIGTLLLLFRFAGATYQLFAKAAKHQWMRYKNARLILLNEKTATHTFLNTIFVSESDYKGHTVEEEILTHELTHVRQKHTLDILFIELVISIVWFNPFFILYKRAIQLNHEFLADDAVIDTHKNIPAYQYLLLDKISQHRGNRLSSSLNFLITKKRLAMMKQMKNNQLAVFKTVTVAALLTGAFFLFSEKVYAQVKKDPISPQTITPGQKAGEITLNNHGNGVSDEQFKVYQTAINSAYKKKVAKNGTSYLQMDITGLDIKKLRSIYENMSKEQQKKAPKLLGYIPLLPPLPRKSPTANLLESWEDAAMYGVWLDNKRIDNKDLTKYKPSDFGHYDVSKLYPNATNYGKHYYQVNLMTTAFYDKDLASYNKFLESERNRP